MRNEHCRHSESAFVSLHVHDREFCEHGEVSFYVRAGFLLFEEQNLTSHA